VENHTFLLAMLTHELGEIIRGDPHQAPYSDGGDLASVYQLPRFCLAAVKDPGKIVYGEQSLVGSSVFHHLVFPLSSVRL
jgi:hypothetical protein